MTGRAAPTIGPRHRRARRRRFGADDLSAAEPGFPEVDVAEQDVAEPDVAEPDVAEPDVAEPASVASPSVRPGSVQPWGRPGPAGSAGRAAIGGFTEVVVVLVMALALSWLLKTFLVQAFYIPSNSMNNTLLVGDRVLVSKITPRMLDLHHGDVVVFKDPGGWLHAPPPPPQNAAKSFVQDSLIFVGLLPQNSDQHLIKRVIGLPGDVVSCDGQGRVVVNGVAIDETPYLFPGNQPGDAPAGVSGRFSVTVPPGHLWVMGDHRAASADSRAHPDIGGGFVPLDDVVGKAFVLVWPLDRTSGLGVPDPVFDHVPSSPPAGG